MYAYASNTELIMLKDAAPPITAWIGKTTENVSRNGSAMVFLGHLFDRWNHVERTGLSRSKTWDGSHNRFRHRSWAMTIEDDHGRDLMVPCRARGRLSGCLISDGTLN